MVNEASRCLDEKIIDRADFLDLALIMGTGFPPFRGGLLKYADNVGIAEVIKTLQQLKTIHGIRFEPSSYLLNLGTEGQTFY